MIFRISVWKLKNKIVNFFLSKKIQVNSNISFGSLKANNFFLKCLKKSEFYIEYGSGSSTLLAKKLNKEFISIESDSNFYSIIKERINSNCLKLYSLGIAGDYGYPLINNQKKIRKYIFSINKYLKKNTSNLILIDGRFRVACCLNILNLNKKKLKNTHIIVDDFLNRSHYKILNRYFKIQIFGRLGYLIVKKNKYVNNRKSDFEKFCLDPR